MSMGVPPGREELRAWPASKLGMLETSGSLPTFETATAVNAIPKPVSGIAHCAQATAERLPR
jgi:hypothetical protein